LAESAFDLFLGKPALLVEHHSFFRDGYVKLAEFVGRLNTLEKQLEWTTLAKIISRACLKKVAENGDVHIKFYADGFWLQNDTDRPQNYVLFRRVVPEEPLTRVTINGCHTDSTQEANCLKIRLSLYAGQTAEVRIQRDKVDPVAIPFKQKKIQRARVFIRRRLCEFRDNYVDQYWNLRKGSGKN
jgi:hypothetical protein